MAEFARPPRTASGFIVGGGGRTGAGAWDQPYGESSASGIRQAEGAGGGSGAGEEGREEGEVSGSPSRTAVRLADIYGTDYPAAWQRSQRGGGVGRAARSDEDRAQGCGHGGVGGAEPGVVGRRGMIQITVQTRILVAIQAVDFRKGIDGLARVCQQQLQTDPFSGRLFVFRNRRRTALKILAYDGRGFWLCQKRLSRGRFP